MKVRRVDFYPDDWIAGTVDLTLEERGVYITACALIYSRGGPIERAHLRNACPGHGRPFNAALRRLLDIGKLAADGNLIDQRRCEAELHAAHSRIEKWTKNLSNSDGSTTKSDACAPRALGGGNQAAADPASGQKLTKNDRNFDETSLKKSRKNRVNIGKADTYADRAGLTRYNQDLESESKNLRGELGRSAPSGRDASTTAEQRDALTADERAEMVSMFDEVLATLKGGMPKGNGVHDQAAYQAAVKQSKRDAWLRELHTWASQRLEGAARTEAWEALAEAMAAGSRDATPKHIRRRIDELDQLYRAEKQRIGAA